MVMDVESMNEASPGGTRFQLPWCEEEYGAELTRGYAVTPFITSGDSSCMVVLEFDG